VGEIQVADLTLSEVKKKVITGIKKKYLAGDPSVTLLNPRQITVTVTGLFGIPENISSMQRIVPIKLYLKQIKSRKRISYSDRQFKQR